MVQTATNTFYNRIIEGSQCPGKGEKQRDKACPDAGHPPRTPYGFLEGQGIRQMPNLDRWDIGLRSVQTMVSLLKWLATNAINWDIGWHSALRTQKPQGQAPSRPSRWFNRTEVAHSSQPALIAIMGLEPRVQVDAAGRSENFLFDTGTTNSVLTSCSRAFSSQTCTSLVATGKIIRKRFT